VTKAYTNKTEVTGKELIMDVLKHTKNTIGKGEISRNDNDNMRRMRTAAFSCSCTVVRVTQTDEKPFGSIPWSRPFSRLLDLDEVPSFPLWPEKRFKLLKLCDGTGAALPQASSSRKRRGYITATQMLSQSSLSQPSLGQDLGERSLAGTKQSAEEHSLDSYSNQELMAKYAGDEGSADQDEGEQGGGLEQGKGVIELEMSPVNREPIMQALVRVLAKMHSLFGQDWADK
ncbi:unnamed protein product, partial [Chrysoparadoxa australica]